MLQNILVLFKKVEEFRNIWIIFNIKTKLLSTLLRFSFFAISADTAIVKLNS